MEKERAADRRPFGLAKYGRNGTYHAATPCQHIGRSHVSYRFGLLRDLGSNDLWASTWR